MKKISLFSKASVIPLTLLGFITSLSPQAIAGSGSSGGGRAIVCFSSKKIADRVLSPQNPRQGIVTGSEIPFITNVETLDLYWAKQANAQVGNISYPPSGDDFALVNAVVSRVWNGFPQVAENLQYYSANHPDRDQIVKLPNGLQQLDDAAEAFVPDERCVVTTVARQSNHGNGIVLELDERLVSRMKDDYSKKALFLHETLYSWARSTGARTSDGVRIILARLISNQPLTKELNTLIQGSGMKADSTLYPNYYNRVFSELKTELGEKVVSKGLDLAIDEAMISFGFTPQAVEAMAPLIKKRAISQLMEYKPEYGYSWEINIGSDNGCDNLLRLYGKQATRIDDLKSAYSMEVQAKSDLENQLSNCKKHSCRKKLKSLLAEAVKKTETSRQAWTVVESYMRGGSRRFDWPNDLMEKGGILERACQNQNAARPAIFSEICPTIQQDINAWNQFVKGYDNSVKKLSNTIYRRMGELFWNEVDNGEIRNILEKDQTLNRIPHNQELITGYGALQNIFQAIYFLYDKVPDVLNDFIVP